MLMSAERLLARAGCNSQLLAASQSQCAAALVAHDGASPDSTPATPRPVFRANRGAIALVVTPARVARSGWRLEAPRPAARPVSLRNSLCDSRQRLAQQRTAGNPRSLACASASAVSDSLCWTAGLRRFGTREGRTFEGFRTTPAAKVRKLGVFLTHVPLDTAGDLHVRLQHSALESGLVGVGGADSAGKIAELSLADEQLKHMVPFSDRRCPRTVVGGR
jgi:hypothetical protein